MLRYLNKPEYYAHGHFSSNFYYILLLLLLCPWRIIKRGLDNIFSYISGISAVTILVTEGTSYFYNSDQG